jgi:hypothetical protein
VRSFLVTKTGKATLIIVKPNVGLTRKRFVRAVGVEAVVRRFTLLFLGKFNLYRSNVHIAY